MKNPSHPALTPEEKDHQPETENVYEDPQSDQGTADAPVIPPRTKRRPVKRKFIAGLLAAIIPGAGHLYLGLLRKGISFLFAIILDIAALLYFSSIGMQINVPLLILLALLIPCLYFFNVYDALQSADRIIRFMKMNAAEYELEEEKPQRTRLISEPGISFGLFLLGGGVLLFLFRQKPTWLQFFIEHHAGAAAGGVLIAAGLLFMLREITLSRRRGAAVSPKLRIGRYTSSIVLIGVGALLFRDWLLGTDDMLLLLKWWPVIPILWGLEYLILYTAARRPRSSGSRRRVQQDLRSLVPAILLGACVFIVSEQEHYLQLWNKVSLNLTAAAVDYGEAKGSRFVKPPVAIPVELNSAKLTVDAINGDILVHRSPIDDIEITATVWVDQLTGVRAQAVSDQSFIEVTEGPTIKLTTKGKAYGDSGKRQPRIDLDIAVPDTRRFDLQITTMSGGITLQNVEAIQDIGLETGNGPIILHQVFGNIKGKTLNGEVRIRNIQGTADLTTNGGDMMAWNVSSSLKLSTAVGNIVAEGSGAELDLSTKNGNVNVKEAPSSLNLQSLNGVIEARSSSVQGDWNIYSAVGDINLYLPEIANYSLKGSSGYGNIESDLPELTIDKKTITGTAGTGEYKIDVEGNSNLNVRKQ